MAPFAKHGKFEHQQRGKHQHLYSRLVETDQAIQGNRARERQTNGAYQAKHREATHSRRCKGPGQHDMASVDPRSEGLMLFRLRRVGIAPAFKNSVSRLRTLAFVLLARLPAPQQIGQRRNGAHPTAKRLPKHKRNDHDNRKADERARDESPATEYGFQRTERADIRDSVVVCPSAILQTAR